jgi:hypothetical protein
MGNRPEFYGIFEAAVDAMAIIDRRMIDSSFGPPSCGISRTCSSQDAHPARDDDQLGAL